MKTCYDFEKYKKPFSVFICVLSFITLTTLGAGCNFREFSPIKSYIKKNEEITTRQTDEAIKQSPELQDLDNVCKGIKIPGKFEFVSKGGLDDQEISLSYHYTSDLDFQEAKIFLWSISRGTIGYFSSRMTLTRRF